jgi:hypothetical protein
MYHYFNIQQFYVLPTQCIYVFCVDLRTNSDYSPIQNYLTGFYNGVKAQWLLYVSPGLTSTKPTFWPHSVFVCFMWISEQTAIIPLYSINWLVFITESVYCAVRARSLYTASLTFSNSTFCPHSVFVCFMWISEQTAIISLYSIN